MDKYFFAITALIVISIFFILYIRISTKISKTAYFPGESERKAGGDSAEYDSVTKDPLSHLKSSNYPNPSDFTLLE